MAIATQEKIPSAFIEAEDHYTQTRVIGKIQLAAGEKLEPGTPLVWDAAANAGTGAFVKYVTGAPTDKPAILIGGVENTGAASAIVEAAVLYRGPAIIDLNEMAWDPATTDVDKRAFIAAWETIPTGGSFPVEYMTVSPTPVFFNNAVGGAPQGPQGPQGPQPV